MQSLAVVLVLAAALIAGLCFVYARHTHRKECARLNQYRQSLCYARLHRELKNAISQYDLMQLRIEPWGVLATSVYPAHTVLRFRALLRLCALRSGGAFFPLRFLRVFPPRRFTLFFFRGLGFPALLFLKLAV